MEIPFQYLVRQPPFDDERLRDQLRERLNSIDGVDISAAMLSLRPGFPIAVLKDDRSEPVFVRLRAAGLLLPAVLPACVQRRAYPSRMAHRIKELREMPLEALFEEHDKFAHHAGMSLNYYLSEIARRDEISVAELIARNTDELAASGKRMERLTWFIAVMTIANVIIAGIVVL